MEVKMSNSIYLDIDLIEFEKQKKEAIETAKANGSENNATFEDLHWDIDSDNTEITEDGKILISGTLDKFGYMSIEITLGLDDIAEIISVYMKKVNKLKTILEATK
jgi:hypothetical protein